jgi:hypothetical protein
VVGALGAAPGPLVVGVVVVVGVDSIVDNAMTSINAMTNHTCVLDAIERWQWSNKHTLLWMVVVVVMQEEQHNTTRGTTTRKQQ